MAELRDIKYNNREFSDFRDQLIEYTKNYFPDSYNDFSPSSPGMMFIEMASYVGDVLSFYQDTQLQETFLTHAKDPKNLFNLAYMMGYQPKVTGVSEVELELSVVIAASGSGDIKPNWSAAPIVNANTVVQSVDSSKTNFLIDSPVDFSFSSSYDPTNVIIHSVDSNNNPTEFKLVKKAKAFSGEVKTKTAAISRAEKFKTITITDTDIIGVLNVTGSDSTVWTEVPFLGQDTVFLDETNSSADSDTVPYIMNLRKVPYRFVSRFKSNGDLDIQFGAGTLSSDDTTILPDASTIGNGLNQGSSNYNGTGSLTTAYDPSNFTYSKAYGTAPTTNLHIQYLVGGGISSNVPANTVTNILTISGTNTSNVTITNPNPAAGGRDGDTVEELRENSLRSFNSQNRIVTLQDYTVRALSLPAKFGSVAKAYVVQDQLTNSSKQNSIIDNNPLALSLYVLGYDNDRKLTTATSTLKANLRTYLSEFMLLTDSISIKDAFVVNIGVNYEVIVRPNYASRDVLLQCNIAIQDHFKIQKRSINQPINLSEIYTILDKIKGTQTIQNVEIVNLTSNEGNYATHGYDITGATKNNIVYPSFDPCIFEIKYPEVDIKGRVTTL
jgi:hypothetical protein